MPSSMPSAPLGVQTFDAPGGAKVPIVRRLRAAVLRGGVGLVRGETEEKEGRERNDDEEAAARAPVGDGHPLTDSVLTQRD